MPYVPDNRIGFVGTYRVAGYRSLRPATKLNRHRELRRDDAGQYIDENLYRFFLTQALVIPQPEPHLGGGYRIHSFAFSGGQGLEFW